jgi:hypothetical protein
MTRGQTVFLFLMICAAVMTGATLGVISNFDIMLHQSQLISDSTAASIDQLPVEPGDNSEIASSVPITVATNDQVSRSNQLMVVTSQEKEEIRGMLRQLGMSEDEQESEFISNFQRSHSLNATGNLDSQTLNLMIKQATYNRASRSAGISSER